MQTATETTRPSGPAGWGDRFGGKAAVVSHLQAQRRLRATVVNSAR